LARAILQTVAYADVFDYPLSGAELTRYLVGVPATREQVERAMSDAPLARRLARRDDLIALPGQERLFDLRRRRAAVAAELWPHALIYGRRIAALPFVRMVAITGALAMDNVDGRLDMDYFIVTRQGRLWLCRAQIITLVRLARLQGHEICPNFLVTEQALSIEEHNLYTAHELAQMVPISGMATYGRMRSINAWTETYLPNAGGPARPMGPIQFTPWPFRRLAESVLSTRFGSWLEGWEMKRKIAKLSRQTTDHGRRTTEDGQGTADVIMAPGHQGTGSLSARGAESPQRPGADHTGPSSTVHGPWSRPEAAFSPDRCKGHFERHGERTLAAFEARLAGLQDDWG